MMHAWPSIFLSLLFAVVPLHAQSLASTCHATSTYDMTLQPENILFDRAAPAPMRVELGHGDLRVDGEAMHLTPDQRNRLASFDHGLRALVPRVRAVAGHGVDLAMQAVRAEADRLGLSQGTRVELDRRLVADVTRVRQRIASSQSTRDWHGAALDQYVSEMSADLLPLITADLGQQALQDAMSGNTQAALALRDKAVDLATTTQSRLRERMQALRPEIAALCPSIRHLAELQRGLTDGHGNSLQLLEINP